MAEPTPQEEAELTAISIVTKQKELEQLEAELMHNQTFKNYLQAKKAFDEQEEILWGTVLDGMSKNGVKKIKGDWGSVTLVEKTVTKIKDLDELPTRFLKKVADTKKINLEIKLKGKIPKGVTLEPSVYLLKKIK